jgi:hypothetical protein
MNEIDKEYLCKMAEEMHAQLEFDTDDSLHLNDFCILSTINRQLIEV